MSHERLLVVEDEEDILELVGYNLRKHGYEVFIATNGKRALELAESMRPDLILLDIMMPGMSGLDVCLALQNNMETKNIPVIFLTARTEQEEIVNGLEIGAVDYMTKPFNVAELASRVKKQLAISRKWKELEKNNRQLGSKIMNQSERMKHTDRLAHLGAITSGIIHDITNINAYMGGFAQMLYRVTPEMSSKSGGLQPKDKAGTDWDLHQMAGHILVGTQRIEEITKRIQDYGRNKAQDSEVTEISEAVDLALRFTENRYRQVAEIKLDLEESLAIYCDRGDLEQILVNLIANAADAIAEKRQNKPDHKGEILIRAGRVLDSISIRIQDNGIGMTDKVKAKLFDNFFSTKSPDKGTGLGMGIVKDLLNSCGGQIEVESVANKGSSFELSLPVKHNHSLSFFSKEAEENHIEH